jgi:hypothetical protein
MLIDGDYSKCIGWPGTSFCHGHGVLWGRDPIAGMQGPPPLLLETLSQRWEHTFRHRERMRFVEREDSSWVVPTKQAAHSIFNSAHNMRLH